MSETIETKEISLKLKGKILIKGRIKTVTGLRIGGGQGALNIGGMDNPVIKDSKGRPYIPGSSLKGKMRCLLERKEGVTVSKKSPQGISQTGDMAKIFGRGADDKNRDLGPTRFYARDAYLCEQSEKAMEAKSDEFKELEFDYTESKWENVIDRINSKAEHPRLMERVPRGASFDFEFVYNVFENDETSLFLNILEGMRLLEDDYIGGSGSRGYGQIRFESMSIKVKTVKDYEEGSDGSPIELTEDLSKIDIKAIVEKLETNEKDKTQNTQ